MLGSGRKLNAPQNHLVARVQDTFGLADSRWDFAAQHPRPTSAVIVTGVKALMRRNRPAHQDQHRTGTAHVGTRLAQLRISTRNSHRDAISRSRFAGWSVLTVWCAGIAIAFSMLFGSLEAGPTRSVLSDNDARLVSTWLQASPEYRPGRATVARFGPAGCSCDPMSTDQWQGLLTRWSRRHTTLYEIDTPIRRPASLAHVEIAIADAEGRLVYAGPFDNSPMCGSRPAMDVVIARAHTLSSTSTAATSPCSCP